MSLKDYVNPSRVNCQEFISESYRKHLTLDQVNKLSIKALEPQPAGSLRPSSAGQSGSYGFVDNSDIKEVSFQSILDLRTKKEIDSEVEYKRLARVDEAIKRLKASILDKRLVQTWKEEDSFPVSGKKCHCRSVWCPVCFRYFYHDKILKTFEPFDWKYTRQVVLTVDPASFASPWEAVLHIREKRSVGEFVKRLRRGVREKVGGQWIIKYHSVNVVRWAWFLEWHSNGFPHYHVFIQTDRSGKAAMIGGDFLRDSWKLASWVREEYFKNENHFKNLTGYYADKGYFDKKKKHQGVLPDEIKERAESRIKRFGSSERKIKSAKGDKEMKNLFDEAKDQRNFDKICMFFREESNKEKMAGCWPLHMGETVNALVNHFLKEPDKRCIDYKVILQRCGKFTFIELDLVNIRVSAVCDINYEEWKSFPQGIFMNGRGRVNRLNLYEIAYILSKISKVIEIKEYMDIYEYCRRRRNLLDQWENDRENILMQR